VFAVTLTNAGTSTITSASLSDQLLSQISSLDLDISPALSSLLGLLSTELGALGITVSLPAGGLAPGNSISVSYTVDLPLFSLLSALTPEEFALFSTLFNLMNLVEANQATNKIFPFFKGLKACCTAWGASCKG